MKEKFCSFVQPVRPSLPKWFRRLQLRLAKPHCLNLRLKLSGRGGRLVGKGSILIAAAPARSLSAIR